MAAYQHHICFVSHQNVPELLGASLPGPCKTALHAVTTREMASRAETLKKTCSSHGLKCTLYSLDKMDPSEIANLLDDIWLGVRSESWAINITGGTKIMSLAAYSWAIQNNIPAFYIDTASKKILFHDKETWKILPLPDILRYEALLNIYGYEVEKKVKKPVSVPIRAAMAALLELAGTEHGRRAFHLLNERACAASSTPDLAVSYICEGKLPELLAICRDVKKLDYTHSHIIFSDESSRMWCNGLWLEECVQAVLAGLEGDGRITSWATSVEVAGNGIKNELDAIFTVNNRLYVIECKTSRMKNHPFSTSTSILYKADSLRDRLGGIFAKSMLCSLDGMSGPDADRAKELGIKTIIGGDIKNLRKKLIEWIKEE